MLRLITLLTGIMLSLLATQQSLAATKPFMHIQHWQTKKGVPVYFVESHEVPMADIIVSFYAGSGYDNQQPGLAALTNSSLATGTKQHDANSIAEHFAALGAQFSNTLNKEVALVSLRIMSDKHYLEPGLKMLTEILHQPSFTEQEVSRERNELLSTLQYQQQLPGVLADQHFAQLLYQAHPYATPTLGNPESVSKLSAKDTKNFFRRYYVAQNAQIIIVGDQTLAQAKTLAEKISQSLQPGLKAPAFSKATPPSSAQAKTIPFPSEQTHILIGQTSLNYHDPAFIPLTVGNYIFGGRGLSSLLFHEIRKKQGLTYGAYSQLIPQLAEGHFIISLATRNDQAQAAISATQRLLQDYTQQGPSKEQVDVAKQFLLGNLPLQFASNAAIANALLKLAIYQLPTDFYDSYRAQIAAVDQPLIKQTWQCYIKPEQMITVQVGAQVAQ